MTDQKYHRAYMIILGLPVIPTFSHRVRSVYLRGLAMGNHPRRFTMIGDCEISGIWFLTDFDLPPNNYNLGNYTESLCEQTRFGNHMCLRRNFGTS